MNGLEKQRVLDPDKLDGICYLQSLLEQAEAKGLVGDEELERLQYECLTLLANTTKRYNAGDSSSIAVEKAQALMSSNLFTIGLWLKSCPHPDDAVALLQGEPVASLYQKGRKRIGTLLASARTIYTSLLGRLVDFPNIYYRLTLQEGLPAFFKRYDADFAADESHMTADYPTLNPIPQLAGIEFVQAYLHGLSYENQFCACFAPEELDRLFRGTVAGDPEQLQNLYAPVLWAALGCIAAGVDVHSLRSAGNAQMLSRLLAKAPDALGLLQRTADELARRLCCPPGLTRYLQDSLPVLLAEYQGAAM